MTSEIKIFYRFYTKVLYIKLLIADIISALKCILLSYEEPSI